MSETGNADGERRIGKWLLGTIALLVVAGGAWLGLRLYSGFSLLHAGEQIDIGGRDVFIHCEGTGSPTVLLEHGLGSNGHEWQAVQHDVADHARVCWTSRAGMGFSDRASGNTARTAQDAADDLSSVLDDAEIPGPYVVVGHSFGGYVVRLFAAQHRDDVVGVVLVDSTHEQQPSLLRTRLSSAAWSELSVLFGADNPENMDLIASAEQIHQAPDLGSRPLIVLEAAEQGTDASEAGISGAAAAELDATMTLLWPELQADLATLSTEGIHHVVPASSHFIQIDSPDAVVNAIMDVLSQTTAGP